MRCKALIIVSAAFAYGCVTAFDPTGFQSRLDTVSAPLMSAWGALCETNLAGLESQTPKCSYEVLVREDEEPNAYADGEYVFVTSGMLARFKDLSLSLVIAHEMAHNVLGHVHMDIAESREREADRWALYLMKAAGLDYETAARNPECIEGPNTSDPQTLAVERRREDHFEAVIFELKPTQ